MTGNVIKRLEDLERLLVQDPLIVLARTDRGEEVKLSMRECLEREDAHFVKVISGSSLNDLDSLLREMEKEAGKE